MPPSSEDFRGLQVSIEELTRAERELIAILQKAGGSGGLGGGAGSKSDSAAGMGMSPLRQGGVNAMGSVLGFSQANLVSATINRAVVQPIEDLRSINQAGRVAERDAFIAGARGSGLSARRRVAETEAELDFTEKYGTSKIFNFGFEYGKGFTSREKAERGNAQVRSFLARQQEDVQITGESARERTLRQIAPLAAAGGFEGDSEEASKEITADIYRLNLKQAQGIQAARRYLELIDSNLNSANVVLPGSQGQRGSR